MRRKGGAAGQIVPPWSIDGVLMRFVIDRVGGLWRWRELTLPLAALYLAYWLAGGYAATWAAAVFVYVLAPVALVRPSAVGRIPRRCIARSRWHRRRRRWPRVCVGLHWYRKLDHDALLIPE